MFLLKQNITKKKQIDKIILQLRWKNNGKDKKY